MIRKPLFLCAAGFVLAIGACDSSTGPSSSELTQVEANELAAAMDGIATLGANDFGLGQMFASTDENGAALSGGTFTFNNQFSVTRQCPQGGQVTFAGTKTGSADRATHSLSVHAVATRTDANCAFQTRNGVVTLNGNPNIAFEGQLTVVGGRLSGLQTQTQEGSFTVAREGRPLVTCNVDLSSSFDPATHTATVTGTFCGRTIDVTHTRG